MAEYLLILEVPAREFYQRTALPSERVRLERIFHELLADPFVDNETRFPFDDPPNVAAIYYDGEFWVIYSVVDYRIVSIVNVGFEQDPPRANRE